jgi:hypothetical protein
LNSCKTSRINNIELPDLVFPESVINNNQVITLLEDETVKIEYTDLQQEVILPMWFFKRIVIYEINIEGIKQKYETLQKTKF